MSRLSGLFRALEGASDLIQGASAVLDKVEDIAQVIREEGAQVEPLSPDDPPLVQGAKVVSAYSKRVSARVREPSAQLVAGLSRAQKGVEKIRGK